LAYLLGRPWTQHTVTNTTRVVSKVALIVTVNVKYELPTALITCAHKVAHLSTRWGVTCEMYTHTQ